MKRVLCLVLAFASLSLFSDEMKDQMRPEAEASYSGSPSLLFIQMQRGSYTHRCSYGPNGLLTEESDIHGNSIRYNYDAMDRLIKYDTGTYLYELEYDPLGNLVKRYLEDSLYIKEQTYAYDGLSQITQDDDKTYVYDSLNNALVRDNIPHKINELNQVIHDGIYTYEYDVNGNRTAKTANGQRTTYTYDPLNRLIAANDRNYIYDPFNRLIRYDNKELIYDDNKEIGSLSDGHLEYRILRPGVESEVGNILCMELHNKTYSTIKDHLGHCVGLLDEDGIEEIYEYSAFKLERVYKGNGDDAIEPLSPWGFCSKRHLPTEAFVNFGRRVYDMNLGRWLTQDPLGHADGPNLYAYVHNNALNTIDEFGLYSSGELWQKVNQRIAYTQAISCGFVAGMGQGICGIGADICGMAAYMDSGLSYTNPFCQSFSPSQSSCQQGRRSLDDVSAVLTRLCRPDSDDPTIQKYFRNAQMVGAATTEAAMFVLPGGAALSLASKTALVTERVLGGAKAISRVKEFSNLTVGIRTAGQQTITIAGRLTGYTRHGLNQAIGRDYGRGVHTTSILEALRSPMGVVEQANGSVKYVGKNATVILNSEGRLITAFGKSRGPQVWDKGGAVVQPPFGAGHNPGIQ